MVITVTCSAANISPLMALYHQFNKLYFVTPRFNPIHRGSVHPVRTIWSKISHRGNFLSIYLPRLVSITAYWTVPWDVLLEIFKGCRLFIRWRLLSNVPVVIVTRKQFFFACSSTFRRAFLLLAFLTRVNRTPLRWCPLSYVLTVLSVWFQICSRTSWHHSYLMHSKRDESACVLQPNKLHPSEPILKTDLDHANLFDSRLISKVHSTPPPTP